jgi:hypothetical protein
MYLPSRRARTYAQRFAGLSGGPVTPTLASLHTIGDGSAGTIQTLKMMRTEALKSLLDPQQIVRLTVLELCQDVAPRDWLGQVEALHEFVRDNIRYMPDPADIELLQTPQKTLEFGQGDCDDQSMLLAAMLKCADHPARFIAVGFDGGPFSHVLCDTKIGADWVPCETIVQVPLGWFPEGVTKSYILDV